MRLDFSLKTVYHGTLSYLDRGCMRLKKLVLHGFKSFADKTTLHFDAGITCIVGPNGCGKSNIADAFRWVMGEQSAKSMRGHKMPDIIFAGTNKRKPQEFAEVSLTLTDIRGALPLNEDEITLTRRLHRNGESEYLLNGKSVRLKDFQALFLDSGMGRNAFAIFEQGKIDQVINYTPVERRYIFEEAAGILRFLQRKNEALKRLEQADLNLSRVQDIHLEIEKQIQVLQAQAEKAKRYKENKEMLEVLEKGSYILRWNSLEKKWKEAESRREQHQELFKSLSKKLEDVHFRSQQTKVKLTHDEKILKIKNEEFFKIQNEKEIHIRDNASNQQKLDDIKEKEKKLKRGLEELKLAQKTRQTAYEEIKKQQGDVEASFKEAESKLNSQTDKVKLKEKEVAELRQNAQGKQQHHLKLLQNESKLGSEFKQHETRLENLLDRRKLLEEKKNQAQEDVRQLGLQAQEKKQQLNDVSATIDGYKIKLQNFENEFKAVSKAIENKQKEADSAQRQLIEKQARHQVLIRLREDHEGFSSGSKKLLKENEDPNSPLYQKIRPLYEFVNANAEQAQAWAAILRNYSQTLVVDKEDDLKQILEFCIKNKIQDYSLLCLEIIKGLFKQSNLMEHLLGTVSQVNEIDAALPFLKKSKQGQIWCNQGLYVDVKGVFFHPKANENQVFLREAELKKIEEELVQIENIFQEHSKQLEELMQKKSALHVDRSELDKTLRREEMKLIEVNFGLQRCLSDQEKLKASKAQMEQDLVVMGDQIEQLQSQVKQFQDKHFLAKQDLAKLDEEIQFLNQELEKQLSALRVQHQNQKEKGDAFRQLSGDRQKIIHQLDVLEIKKEEYQKQENHFLVELEELKGAVVKIEEGMPLFQKTIISIEERLAESSTQCGDYEKKVEGHKESIQQIDKELATLQDQTRKVEIEMSQFESQVGQHHASAKVLEEELEERYNLKMEDAKKEVVLDKSLDQTEKQIRALRQALQGAGDVNLASIEDLEKHQSRHHFLKQQVDDMAKSKDELLQIISQIDGESRKLFKQTFDIIRENFKKNFQILFNGGEADLQLTEKDDLLEAGIEIIAKPPGKQMRSITLLSGGEKCLTAVALLFSIFEVKTSPFCILDEIDAPLDDTNVERFTNVVKHFINRCQFLIITHNKRTMAIGDVLFGVSMEEKGVSKLLSLTFAPSDVPEVSFV